MSVAPFQSDFTERARQETNGLVEWLFSLSPDAAVRFRQTLDSEIPALCQRVAESISAGRPLTPDDFASVYFSRPVYLHLITTNKRRTRRSTSGMYRVYYELLDKGGTGMPDPIRIVSVRHAAARPLSVEVDGEEVE